MVAFGAASSSALAAVSCDRVASPSGSDSNGGSVGSPYRSVQKLVGSLSSGQTGCLRGGTYGSPTTETVFSTPNVTITSYPGERATMQGWPNINGAGTTVSYLNFDLDDVDHTTSHCADSGGRPRARSACKLKPAT
jgi:hypothetical protein